MVSSFGTHANEPIESWFVHHHCHCRRLCRATLSRLLIIETSYFTHICTYVLSQSLAIIMLLWPLFSNWQPYLCFSLNLSPGHTVDDTDFIFGRLMHLYTLFMCAKNGIDAIYIFSLAAIFVFFSDQHISNLILFRHFANEHCSMYCLSFTAKWAQVPMDLFLLYVTPLKIERLTYLIAVGMDQTLQGVVHAFNS